MEQLSLDGKSLSYPEKVKKIKELLQQQCLQLQDFPGVIFGKINQFNSEKEICNQLKSLKDPVYQEILKSYPPTYFIFDKEKRQRMFFSKIEKRSSGRSWIVGYSFNPFKILHYWKSNSESYWRFCPEMQGSLISKAQDIEGALYESTTKVSMVYHQIFSFFDISKETGRANPRTSYEWLCQRFNKNKTVSDIPSLRSELQIVKLFPGFPYSSADICMRCKDSTWEKVKNHLSYYTLDYLSQYGLNCKQGKIVKKKDGFHELLKKTIDTYLFSTEYHGEKVSLIFSREHGSKKVWIESAHFPKAGLTSQKVYKKQLNMGYLMMKPVDYKEQCTSDAGKYCSEVGSDYYDIRSIYDTCPLMQFLSSLADQFDLQNK